MFPDKYVINNFKWKKLAKTLRRYIFAWDCQDANELSFSFRKITFFDQMRNYKLFMLNLIAVRLVTLPAT